MVGASLYIIGCSAKNRTLVRLRRLREPRYLVGAVAGAAYFYFAVFIPRRAGARRGRPRRPLPPAAVAVLGQAGPVAAAGLLFAAGAAWLFPTSSRLLDFTEAETDLLFPAPVSRGQLVVHRLMRSQLALLFAAAASIFFVSIGTMSIFAMTLRAVALWISFLTARIFFAGVTMARARLGSPDSRARRTAWIPLVMTVAAIGAVGVPVLRTVLGVRALSMSDAVGGIRAATATGPAALVMLPFRALLQLLFADGAREYLAALPGALLVLIAALAWVLKSDGIFQAAAELPAVTAIEVRGRRPRAAPRVRASGWRLPLSGRTETALMWKNAMQTLRGASLRSLLPPLVALLVSVSALSAGLSVTRNGGLAAVLSVAALMMACGVVLVGPLGSTSDLRGDLRHMELLKTWPVQGGALIRGEMLWPAMLLTAGAWLALVCGALLSAAAFPRLTLAWRASLCVTMGILAPALVFAQFTVHQTAAVLFPAWIPAGNEMRGFDALGQRMLMFAGVLIGVILIVGPGAIAGGIVAFVFYRLTASPLIFVPAAILCVAIVAIEILMATESLGPAYDRIDLAGVERAE